MNEDAILAKTSEILENLNDTHTEHMGLARITHGMAAASYSWWHDNDVVADRLKKKT